MEWETRTTGDVTILNLNGRFDAYAAPPVAAWLTTAVGDPARVVVNLAGVNFVDSTGLATLVQGMKHCRQRGGDLRLCALQQPVRIIFELTRMDRAFMVVPTEEAAVESFAAEVGADGTEPGN